MADKYKIRIFCVTVAILALLGWSSLIVTNGNKAVREIGIEAMLPDSVRCSIHSIKEGRGLFIVLVYDVEEGQITPTILPSVLLDLKGKVVETSF